ncbi:MAG: Asp23/Gls24 family envelope stress response protein [Anaerolineae bacterium]
MEETTGSIVIAPEVLTTVVRLVALETPGVVAFNSTLPGRMSRVLRGNKSSHGIDVQIEDGAVTVDVYIIAERNVVLLPLGQTLQREISRAISDVVGMPVRAVNVHIEDVSDPFGTGTPPQ